MRHGVTISRQILAPCPEGDELNSGMFTLKARKTNVLTSESGANGAAGQPGKKLNTEGPRSIFFISINQY